MRCCFLFDSSIEKVRINCLEIGYDAERTGEKPVGGRFYIPKYQRGYRWTRQQIKDLLTDIDEFRPSNDPDDQYCLQPIVVQKKRDSGQWMVIDGQQRLTTVFIILACLEQMKGNEQKPIYELEYESKPELWECLSSFGREPVVETDYSDIDRYHMTNAYRTVYEWVKDAVDNTRRGKDFPSELSGKIRSRTCVIWYEVSGETSGKPEEIFTRINMGKIPLTNAELIKALLLKKDNFDPNISKDYVRSAQTKVSMEWDQMETALHKRDFWLFLTNDKEEKRDVRVEMVFDIMARYLEEKKNELVRFENLQRTNPYTYLFQVFSEHLEDMITTAKADTEYNYEEVLSDFWQEISSFYQVFRDWYEDREWYHLTGYWIAAKELEAKRTDISEILYDLCKRYRESSKSSFTRELKEMILEDIIQDTDHDCLAGLTVKDLSDSFSGLNYDNASDKIRIHKILLLFNVITVQNSAEHMSRFPFHEYKNKKIVWNLEHIHSVTDAVPSNNQEARKWLEDVKNYLESVEYFRDDDKNISGRLSEMADTEVDRNSTEFRQLYTDVTDWFSSGRIEDGQLVNGIMNLTLLDEHTNKSYKNAIFPIKRRCIMEKMGSNSFVPICTKNVFLKYYTAEVRQFYVWDKKDRESYFDRMCSIIHEYMTEAKMDPDWEDR